MKNLILISTILFVTFVSCTKEETGTFPSVVTLNPTEITQSSAKCGGAVIPGDLEIIVRGVCVTSSNNYFDVESAEIVTTDGSGDGNFTSEVSGLHFRKKYYVKAYATNSYGTGYGEVVSFKTKDVQKPTVETLPLSNITSNSVQAGGNVTDDGDDGGILNVNRGVCWSTHTNPTWFEDNSIQSGSGKGEYNIIVSGLSPSTTYYLRAYAESAIGTGYGEELEFTTLDDGNINPPNDPNAVYDYDGNAYKTVVIGNQEWLAENLKSTHYENGDQIPIVTDDYLWESSNFGAMCYYENNISYKDIYGALYNWYAVADSRNVCPSGWHVSTNGEWSNLLDFLGENAVGELLKSGSNTSGFSALPAGYRGVGVSFQGVGEFVRFWTSTSYAFGDNEGVWATWLDYDPVGLGRDETEGNSVRCIKN